MTTKTLSTMRELDTRVNDGIHVRMLWCEHEQRVSVAVTDVKTGENFSIEVRDGERPLDVFHHPYAYAAWHGVVTTSRSAVSDDETLTELAA